MTNNGKSVSNMMNNEIDSTGNFFCLLGLPKSGTTWLAEYLRTNPAVQIPPIKELQLFNRRFRPDLYRWMDDLFQRNLINKIKKLDSNKNNTDANIALIRLLTEIYSIPLLSDDTLFIENYRKILMTGYDDDHLCFGEMSTTYATLHPEHLQLLDTCFENTKYIIVLRDPKKRLWSHIKHKARFFDSDPVKDIDRWLADKEISELNEYQQVLDKVFSVIPRDRVIILFYEEIFSDGNNNSLKSLCSFLQIEYFDANKDEVVYASKKLNLPYSLTHQLNVRTADNYSAIQALIGHIPDNWEN